MYGQWVVCQLSRCQTRTSFTKTQLLQSSKPQKTSTERLKERRNKHFGGKFSKGCFYRAIERTQDVVLMALKPLGKQQVPIRLYAIGIRKYDCDRQAIAAIFVAIICH